ncbi:MAG: helix-turn-helix domain-containing protein [Flammeovirgaceae bacterium]
MHLSIPYGFSQGELHQTDFFEIIVFTKAKGTLVIDQQKIELRDHLIVFLSPFQKRQWFVENGAINAQFLIFQEAFLNDFFSDQLFTYRLQYFYQQQHPFYLQASEQLFNRLQVILAEINGELKLFRCDSSHLIRSLLYFILIRLNRDYALAYGLGTETQVNNYAYQFKQLLEQHIQSKQRIEDYTELIGISRITLNKATKVQFKQTATELIKNRLFFELKNLLVYSNQTINELAYQLNFSEPNHLIRFFKRMSGLTPAAYRATYQNGHL